MDVEHLFGSGGLERLLIDLGLVRVVNQQFCDFPSKKRSR